MERIGLGQIKQAHRGAVATLGNFDGVHRGHQHMLQETVALAQQRQCPSMLILFEPQPLEYFSPNPPARLTTLDEKCIEAAKLGLDIVLCLDFGPELASMSPEDFISMVLHEALAVSHLIVGDDFRFGRGREGDFALLQRLGAHYGFTSTGLGSIIDAGQRISSTRIREALKVGNFDLAARLLGRPYTMRGLVEQGDQRGRLLGYPTANMSPGRRMVPFTGVFGVKIHGLGSVPLLGMANLGTRPTVDGQKTLLEVHIFHFNETIYGKTLEVEFCHKIRDEQRFASLDALKAQIQADHIAVESYFNHG